MVTREDIQNEAGFIKHLMEAANPTGGKHTPTPWKARGQFEITTTDDLAFVAQFRSTADRDLALYFANAHAGMISLLRNVAGAFAFIATATDDEGLHSYANQMAESTGIFTDIFCRLGKLADGKDLPMPPEIEGDV